LILFIYFVQTAMELTWELRRCSRRSGRQRWLEETHCPMCYPARDGL